MAEKKRADMLKGMLNQTQRPPAPTQEVVSTAPTASAGIVKGAPYQAGFRQIKDSEIDLPSEAAALSTRLQDIARHYLGARRKSGEALLEAARWMSEARSEAEHGEWLRFLDITGTTSDAAERLLNTHTRAMSDASFAEAIRTNWLGPSAAALLARPSTPPELIAEVLNAPEPPKVTELTQKVKQARQPKNGQIPQFAVFDSDQAPTSFDDQIPQFAVFGAAGEAPISASEMLRETVKALTHLERSAAEIPATSETRSALARAKQALAAIERTLGAK